MARHFNIIMIIQARFQVRNDERRWIHLIKAIVKQGIHTFKSCLSEFKTIINNMLKGSQINRSYQLLLHNCLIIQKRQQLWQKPFDEIWLVMGSSTECQNSCASYMPIIVLNKHQE
uniref:Uncharacterized protein n=1 Tax=Opuntia streptacantha TaxID=393608 RepID=A0A7C9D665_OPUST